MKGDVSMSGLKIFILLLAVTFCSHALADEKRFLTLDELIANGYMLMSGQQIKDIMAHRAIRVVDIETEAVTVSAKSKSSDTMDRKFVEKKADRTSSMLDPQLMARAPALEGNIERKVVGDELISTDGLRTYHFRLYKKQDRIFAVRDIDHGNVFYEVELQ